MIDRKSTRQSPVTRAELESVAWRLAADLVSPVPAVRYAAMDRILAAADSYAEHLGVIATQRRIELAPVTVREARNRCRAVHLNDPGETGRNRPACRVTVRHHQPLVTHDPAEVTCHSCMATAAYGAAAMGLAS